MANGLSSPLTTGSAAGLGALILGAAGFAAGFFGPIALNPSANQGPLLGIFLTGPGGMVLGAVLGIVLAVSGASRKTINTTLVVTAAAGTAIILFFCLPQPEFRGNVVEIETLACSSPDAFKEEAFAYWDKRIAAAPWTTPRPEWKARFENLVAEDPGVVLSVRVKRSAGLYENRKPWNRGTFAGGKAWWLSERYFRRGVTCTDKSAGVFVARSESSRMWPSDNLPGFLNLQLLEPATDDQSKLLP